MNRIISDGEIFDMIPMEKTGLHGSTGPREASEYRPFLTEVQQLAAAAEEEAGETLRTAIYIAGL
ncbi:hypothetical protein OB236_07350 [Paenibacillus sp. WQ 127069]|uniref:Uncharacterized protein n=1 Tax=Paenibacillus baimaensis TaxID=2982185 RepID=A0ABT2UBC7_9BACL|nr:hypothetical protein [Paenibacillus sp. WQ 127069]MCU6791939.1 hypothetical protein [Paenibacillus sp. WQ 127069]